MNSKLNNLLKMFDKLRIRRLKTGENQKPNFRAFINGSTASLWHILFL
jgi:hypothetical protein